MHLWMRWRGPANPHLPHWYERNAAVYGGTHDNDTIRGYLDKKSDGELSFLLEYLGAKSRAEVPEAMIRAAYESVADIAIFQMQDILELGAAARMNTPSTVGGNWIWRLLPGQFTEERIVRLRRLAELYGRTGG